MPLVSICIPTYNGASYLEECLDSVLAQTFKDFEILIVDDQSSDETVLIAREYANHDRRIRAIINEQNLGLPGNWNRCVQLAQGQWIKFVPQDDFIEPTCLDRMLDGCDPGRAIIFSRRQFLFAEGTSEANRQYHLSTLSVPDKLFGGKTNITGEEYCKALIKQIGAQNISMNFVGEPPAVMLQKEAFFRFGYFHPYLIHYCDFEFWSRVAIHTGIIYVPEVLATFRIHNRSTSAMNAKSRQYRAMELDPLIMLYDFAFHPVYAPLREVANKESSVNLEGVLQDKAYAVRRIAEKALANSVQNDPNLLEEWKRLLELYPILWHCSQRTIFKRVQVHLNQRLKQIRGQLIAKR